VQNTIPTRCGAGRKLVQEQQELHRLKQQLATATRRKNQLQPHQVLADRLFDSDTDTDDPSPPSSIDIDVSPCTVHVCVQLHASLQMDPIDSPTRVFGVLEHSAPILDCIPSTSTSTSGNILASEQSASSDDQDDEYHDADQGDDDEVLAIKAAILQRVRPWQEATDRYCAMLERLSDTAMSLYDVLDLNEGPLITDD
jgi:hypothetical protein